MPFTELWKGLAGSLDAPATAVPSFGQEKHPIRPERLELAALTRQTGTCAVGYSQLTQVI